MFTSCVCIIEFIILVSKLEEGSVVRHIGERKIRTAEDDEKSITGSIATESEVTMETISENELDVHDETIDNEPDSDTERDKSADDKNIEISQETKAMEEDTNTDAESDTNINAESDTEFSDQCVKDENIDTDTGVKTEDSCDSHVRQHACVEEIETKIEFPDTEISLKHVNADK